MGVSTKYRMAEQAMKRIEGAWDSAGGELTLEEIKIAIGQILNKMLKIDYFQTNFKMGELIPNGTVLAQYDGINVTSYSTGKSRATLPVKPMKLPRGMGLFSIWVDGFEDKEFIPLQMGQSNLIKSQPLINNILGQIGYEVSGMTLTFTQDIPQLYPDKTLSTSLVIMDIEQYDDFSPLPILPEMESDVIDAVVAMYQLPIADKVVDSSNKPFTNVPVPQQKQTP